MKKLIFSAWALLCLGSTVSAQTFFDSIGVVNINRSNASASLYAISPEQYNHHFEYKLPNDGLLKIDFLRLSDWENDHNLNEVAAIVSNQVVHLKDSFQSDFTSKFVGINIPIDDKIISINYHEDGTDKNQLAYKDGQYFRLKTSYDTIRVVKNVKFKTKPLVDSGLVQVQYTFILKDINDINKLVSNDGVLSRMAAITDSVVIEKRKVWMRQDATAHNLTMQVDATNKDSVSFFNNRGSFLYGRHIGLYLALGATIYNNSVSPYAEFSLAYFIPTRGPMQGFVGLNFTGFGYVNIANTATSSQVIYNTYNLEFGFCRKGNPLMPQKTSFVMGIMKIREEKPLFSYGITFGINRYASLGLTLATNFKKEEKGGRNVFGVNFKFNL